ncbi:hypothetical protein JB92DRAFT_3116853 [Gautieria morchelliformis]|nr:hypothetical protein JB92DRAFT_3116853 [Gautieria morchelliformis]
MVHEQSNLVFTILFNLSQAVDDKGELDFTSILRLSLILGMHLDLDLDLPYPPADEAVHEFLTLPSAWDVTQVQLHYLLFLLYMFQVEALGRRWREHLEQSGVCNRLYKRAIDRVVEVEAGHVGIADSHLDQPQKYQDPLDVVMAEAKKELIKLLSAMDSCQGTPCFPFPFPTPLPVPIPSPPPLLEMIPLLGELPPVLFALPVPLQFPSSTLGTVSGINIFRAHPLFIIFLSTSSKIEALARGGPMANSARMQDSRCLQAPITEVAFDCGMGVPIEPCQYRLQVAGCRLQEVSNVAFMAKFGTPLFWAMLENVGESEDRMRLEIIRLAQAKLICYDEIDTAECLTKEAVLAVLNVQLNLSFNMYRTSFSSRYPSEPILGEAAAQQMYTFRKHKPSVVVDLLKTNMESGLLDLAVEKDHPNGSQPPFYSQGCNLTTFIEELFSNNYVDIILDSFPDNVKPDATLRDAFKQSKIQFTHFVENGRRHGNDNGHYVRCFRGMAIICHSDQHTVDFMIPVLLWDVELCGEVMTAIFIQVKGRYAVGTKQEYAIDEASLQFFPRPSDSTSTLTSTRSESRPYIALIMELFPPPSATEKTLEVDIPQRGPVLH